MQINTASYYVLGLPIGIFVAFAGPHMGLSGTSLRSSPAPRPRRCLTPPRRTGLWLGLTIALTFTGISSTWICWRMNWEAEAESTRIRLGEAKRPVEEEA